MVKKEIILSILSIEKRKLREGEIIYIIGRDKTRMKHVVSITGFKPFFMVKIECPVPTWDKKIDNIEVKDFKSYLGDTLKKIYTVNSIDIGGTNSDGVKYHFNINDQFESDMPFNTRFKLSNKLKSGVKITYDDEH